jgi:protein-S-isoprenylcysteine O-methyltransferase Ste14
MRNPIRLKNLNTRFLPFFAFGIAVLAFQPPSPGGFKVGLPLILSGAVLRAWGAGHLVKNDRLTTTGPYAHLRHPLYLGTILVATGFGIWAGGWLTLVALGFLWPWFSFHYFPRKERSESLRLEEAYGERFARYRSEVPALWPTIRPWRDARDDGGPERWALSRYDENNELGTFLALSLGVLVFWLRNGGP